MVRLVAALVVAVDLVFAWNTTQPSCQNPRIRKSWHNLTNPERSEYIRAVKCLWTLPAKSGSFYPSAKTRHEDFVSLHINQTSPPDPTNNPANKGVVGPGIHFNGIFLSWHRYLVWNYETSLINECNYTGAQPYWDWTLDNPEYGSSFEKSPVFDATYGFGGNGAGGTVSDPLIPGNSSARPRGTCIDDGPFAGINVTMGFGYNLYNPEPHCLIRNFNISLANQALGWTKNIQHMLGFKNYWNMSQEWDTSTVGAPTGPHGGGHGGVDGEMRNVYSSINDPLFFMHHTQIDHVWWIWQHQDLANNQFAIGGPVYPNGTGGWVTADSSLYMAPFIAEDTKARNVLDTLNKDGTGVLCYTYEDFRYPTWQ